MAAAGITALLKKMDYHDVGKYKNGKMLKSILKIAVIECYFVILVVAIDGSVFRYHPHFSNVMKSRISQLMGIDYKFDLMLSHDGSGRGAALIAAVLASHNH